ncbi:MAG TPA: M67 family metallopeptidase [Verrucomicrobiae bacterium]|nr:M67 family metallopeptidase [Verrucomicrobiae bacterium]
MSITASDLEQLRRHGEDAYPAECCGILLGKFEGDGRRVYSIVPCQNACADGRSTHFVIDPREVIQAQRAGRDLGLEIVGFYHSHPDHPAQWSPTDLEEAHWIGCSYLITSVERGRSTTTNSFLLTGTLEENKAFVSEELSVK